MSPFCTKYDYNKEHKSCWCFDGIMAAQYGTSIHNYLNTVVLCYSSVCKIVITQLKCSETTLESWGCPVGSRHCLNIGLCLQSSSLSLKALEGATSADLAEIEQIVKERMVCCLVNSNKWMHFLLSFSDMLFLHDVEDFCCHSRIIYALVIWLQFWL
jgi:hypothetical protein